MTIQYKGDVFVGLAGKNKGVNGGCAIHQEAQAFTLVKDAYKWACDMMQGMATGAAVSAGTVDRIVNSTIGRTGNAIKFAGVSLAGAGEIYLRWAIESAAAKLLKNQNASFSCKALHDAGANVNYTVFIGKPAAADNFLGTITAIANSGALSKASGAGFDLKFENVGMGDCSNGIEVKIKVEPGTITLKNFEFAELQIEEGSVATQFEFVEDNIEELRCLRYLEKSYNRNVKPGTASNPGAETAKCATAGEANGMRFRVSKRINPTVIIYDVSIGSVGFVDSSTAGRLGGGNVTAWNAGENGVHWITEWTGNTFIKDESIRHHWVADARLY